MPGKPTRRMTTIEFLLRLGKKETLVEKTTGVKEAGAKTDVKSRAAGTAIAMSVTNGPIVGEGTVTTTMKTMIAAGDVITAGGREKTGITIAGGGGQGE